MEMFTAVFEKIDGWWIGFVEELPGANTQGETLAEARENSTEAVQLIVAASREIDRRRVVNRQIMREELIVPS